MDQYPTNIGQIKMIPVYLFIHSLLIYTSPALLISAEIHIHVPLDPFHAMIHLPFDPLPSWAGPGHVWWVGFGAGWGQMTSAIAWGQWCLVHMESTGRMAMLGTGTEPSVINQTQLNQWYIIRYGRHQSIAISFQWHRIHSHKRYQNDVLFS